MLFMFSSFCSFFSEWDMSHLNIFLEFVGGGTLATIIQRYRALPEPVVRSYSNQMLMGLEYLHEHRVLHRDLKRT